MAGDLFSYLNSNEDEDSLNKSRMSPMRYQSTMDTASESMSDDDLAQEAWNANQKEIASRTKAPQTLENPEQKASRSVEKLDIEPSSSASEVVNYGTPVNVGGDFNKKEAPAAAPAAPAPTAPAAVKPTYTKNTDPESNDGMSQFAPWLATLAPYAIEGIFGGGKYMGSAGYGSAEGGKIIRDMEKQRADREIAGRKIDTSVIKALNDLGFKYKKLETDTDVKNERTDIMQQNADTSSAKQAEGNYTFVKSVDANGKPVYTAMDKKTANVLPTDAKVYVPPPSANSQNQRADDYAKRDMSKRVEKLYPALKEAQDYQKNFRSLESLTPKYLGTPDNKLPPNLQNERMTIRRMISTYLTAAIGTAQTDGELARALAGVGISATPATIADMKNNPLLFADRFVGSTDRNSIRRSLDAIAKDTTGKLNVITSGYKPEISKSVLEGSGIQDIPWSEYKEPKAPVKGKETIDERIERLKREMGYKK